MSVSILIVPRTLKGAVAMKVWANDIAETLGKIDHNINFMVINPSDADISVKFDQVDLTDVGGFISCSCNANTFGKFKIGQLGYYIAVTHKIRKMFAMMIKGYHQSTLSARDFKVTEDATDQGYTN